MSVIEDVRRFGLLASAIASRPLAVVAGEAAPTWTDGRTIFLDPAAGAVDARDAVAMQAALLAAGSLRKSTIARLARHRKVVAARYLSLEVERIGVQLDGLLPPATVARVRPRQHRKVSPGSAESLRRALGSEPIPEPPEWLGVVKVFRLLRADAAELGGEPTDDDLDGRTPIDEQPELSEDDAQDSEESKILKLFSAPGVNNPLGEMMQRLLGMGRKAAPGDNQEGGELSVAGRRPAPVGTHGKVSRIDRLLAAVFEPTPATGIRYPEWNSATSEYRNDWCLVAEYRPGDPQAPPEAALTGNESLRRPLARVGVESERHRRQPDGDALDLSALVDYETSRRLGDDPEPRIYENSRSTKRELSVLVLLDASGSTAESTGADTVFEQERQLACDLTASLESLGDRVAAYGFSSRGRDSVRFLRVKTFAERFDAAARRRLAAVQPSGFTRLGAAIRHGTALLQHARARNMILIVIGDGMPYDDGYEGRYAREDTRQAIHEAMRSGVGVVGLGIRSSTDPAVLEDIWSDAPFRVLDTADQARRHLRALLLDALAMTRSNGRRREVSTAEHRTHLRALHTARRKNSNTYS